MPIRIVIIKMENKALNWSKLLSNVKFTEFMKRYDLPKEIFNNKALEYITEEIPRYIRKTKKCILPEEGFLSLFGGNAKNVDFVTEIYSLPSSMKISNLEIYKNSSIAGIDLSSAYVVYSLNPKPNEDILELCCAPGAKLCYSADKMEINQSNSKGSLTGVDISKDRLNICRNLLKKYGYSEKVKVVQADGTSYKSEIQYDKILLDAECTHDGSLKHILKYMNSISLSEESIGEKRKSEVLDIKEEGKKYFSERNKKNTWSLEDFEERFLDPLKLKSIVDLQRSLLQNAFSLLKEGGYLIYSTCSFSKCQNEDLIQEFILEYKGKAQLLPVFEKEEISNIPCHFNNENGWARFDPFISKSGGMFIAKILKLSSIN